MFNKLLYGTISSRGKEAVRRLSHRLSSKPLAVPFLQTRTVVVRPKHNQHILRNEFPLTKSAFNTDFIANSRGFSTHSSVVVSGLIALVPTISLLALFQFTSRKLFVVKVGDRLHEPVREVYPGEIGSEHIQKVIDDLVKVMRKHNLVSISAPQIGVPLQIIVLGDKYYFTGHAPKEHYKVIVNPKLRQLGRKKGLPNESCASVPGYTSKMAEIERFVEVELKGLRCEVQVKGLDQYGHFFMMYASRWYARVLRRACDYEGGTLYV